MTLTLTVSATFLQCTRIRTRICIHTEIGPVYVPKYEPRYGYEYVFGYGYEYGHFLFFLPET